MKVTIGLLLLLYSCSPLFSKDVIGKEIGQENHLETIIFVQSYKSNVSVNIDSVENFSEIEKTIILSGEATDKLHVYQITDEKELTVLKNPSQDIRHDYPLLQTLATRMLATVQDPEHAGVGIAAPQVGINKSLIWVQRFDKVDAPFEFYINPRIVWRSKLSRKGTEGCLSIPDRKEDIERSYAIRLQYQSLDGSLKEENVEGFTAVIFQHEIDHLFGVLYPDRLEEQLQEERIPLNEKIQFSMERGDIVP
ncbi:peptide deformylase [Parapedobacter sp. SGR-10]|uniref:peptide deformylase n=1 Tax=Parapedobacter sp. SGR-10 TaxID=2710879 RepID=UPI0013D614EA|nr:peptide deformylase [Parapedobacter sp. SGR-10]NGF55874.1 peptide deformylase [Parapedobacter sp. SGR-10]